MRHALSRLLVLVLIPTLAGAAPAKRTPAEEDRIIREGCAATYAFRYNAEPESPRGKVALRAAHAAVDDIVARHGGDRQALVQVINQRAHTLAARLSEPEQRFNNEEVRDQVLRCDALLGQVVAKAWTPQPKEDPNHKGWGGETYVGCASLYIAFARRGDAAVQAKIPAILEHETRRIAPFLDVTTPEAASRILLGATRLEQALKTGRVSRDDARATLRTCDNVVGWRIPDPTVPSDAVCIRISNAAIDEINARSARLPKNADKYTLGDATGRNCAAARNGLSQMEREGCTAAQSQILRKSYENWEAQLERLNSLTLSDFACRNW